MTPTKSTYSGTVQFSMASNKLSIYEPYIDTSVVQPSFRSLDICADKWLDKFYTQNVVTRFKTFSFSKDPP